MKFRNEEFDGVRILWSQSPFELTQKITDFASEHILVDLQFGTNAIREGLLAEENLYALILYKNF